MSKLVLVTPEGLIVSDKQSPKVENLDMSAHEGLYPSLFCNYVPKVEKHQEEEPLHVVAAREAAKVSTHKEPPLRVLSGEQETPTAKGDS